MQRWRHAHAGLNVWFGLFVSVTRSTWSWNLTFISVMGSLLLGGCGSTESKDVPAGLRGDMLIPACSWPASANTFDAASGAGCLPKSMFQVCQVSEGSTLHPDGTITTPEGYTVTCQDACAPTEYTLECTGTGWPDISIPAPDPSLACRVQTMPTSPWVLFYCCPCR